MPTRLCEYILAITLTGVELYVTAAIPIYIYIYNSVLTCRQNTINSSARAPLNATKIDVKKVSDVDVCMLGPEL